MGGGSSAPLDSEEPEYFSVPLYRAPQFIISEKGSLCTIREERFLFTTIEKAPILVSLNTSPSILECLEADTPTLKLSKCVGNIPIHVVWDENKSVLLNSLHDGTELFFDAVVFPKTNFYQAILVWQGKKPEKASMMLSGQYLVTAEIETSALSVAFENECGIMQCNLENRAVDAAVNKENYFVDGKRARETLPLSKTLENATALLYEAVTTSPDIKSTASTIYVCGCLWEGSKPNQNLYSAINLKENYIYEYDETKAAFRKPKTSVYLLNNVEGIIQKEMNEICIEFPKLNITLPCPLHFVLNGQKIIKLSKLELPCNVHVTLYQISHQRVYSWKVLHATCVSYQYVLNETIPESSSTTTTSSSSEDGKLEHKLHTCD